MIDILAYLVSGMATMFLIFVIVLLIQDHYFIKNMTLEQAKYIAIIEENNKKSPYSLESYIKAREILLELSCWK